MVVDSDATVASATTPVEQVFGYSPGELIDAPLDTVVADPVATPVAGESPATGATRARCRHASGTEFTARLAWAPLETAPRVAVTVEDAFVARKERYDAAVRGTARSLLRATTWDEAAEALVQAAGSVSSVDDAVLAVPCEAAEAGGVDEPTARLRHAASYSGDPTPLDSATAAAARRAFETDSLTRRERGDELVLVVPLDDHALLQLRVTREPAVDHVVTFARELGEHGAAAFARLDAPEAGTTDGNDGSLVQRNAELRQRVERLEQRNEELQEFTDVVAHDLRNPLNAAQACVELAEHDEGDVSGHLADLENAHARMRDLIDDLLTLTQNGEAVGETRPVSLSAVAEDAWTTVGTEHPADPTLDVEETVPCIEADDERLRTLLENLFGNAVDHAGPDVTVRLGSLADGFYVADDGPGISPEEREHVFEHGYSTHSNGTGYGLAIVEGIATGHGWEITVTEAADGGARFEFHGVESPDVAGFGDGPGGETDD